MGATVHPGMQAEPVRNGTGQPWFSPATVRKLTTACPAHGHSAMR